MPAWQNFASIHVPPNAPSTVRPRFSLTSDILSFRRCGRQYGYFGNDGFVPAQATQIFYGTAIHQVLDRCHRHYWGLAGFPFGTMPLDADIEEYFNDAQNALRSHGVRPASPEIARKALRVIQAFNRVEGPALYPLIRDTEFRLESERSDYVLRGVVDVLARNATDPQDPAQMEIWDYKGSRLPDTTSTEMRDYRWQMCVYAELYRVREGVYPARAILYFLNELDQQGISSRPLRAVCEVTFTEELVQQALQEFDTTADAIIACRASTQWDVPSDRPLVATCNICDIRWNCPHPDVSYPPRMPIS